MSEIMKIGDQILHYHIIERLGKGAMGEIYKAQDTKLKRNVALKFLSSHLLSSAEERARFLKEAQIAAALDHPNICTVYSVESIEDSMLIAMAFIEGVNLEHKIKSQKLKLNEVLNIAGQVASGLKAAHQKGIIHRDLKSANIMITPEGQVKITDFGLAQILDTLKITGTNVIAGTPAYMSPEQALGQEIDQRSDIFSFGIVLYEMITGNLPFKGDSEHAVIYSIVRESPEPISKQHRDIPPALLSIVNKALAKKPADRYQNADELLTDLENISSNKAPIAAKRKLPGIAKLSYIISGLLVLIAILFFYFSQRDKISFSKGDWIAIGEFRNATTDSVFDRILAEALRIGVQQSTHLSVLPRSKITAFLKLMGKPANTALSENVIKEICIRAGVKAYITGQISQVGREYLLSARVVRADDGVDLRVAQVRAAHKDDFLMSIDALSTQLRRGLGESLASIEQNTRPLQEVCTKSLDALRYFSIGGHFHEAGELDKALPFYQRAITLDSTFALAHSILGFLYQNIGNIPDWVAATDRAYQLRKNTTEREQLLIEAFYHLAHQRFSGAIPFFQLILETHPRDLSARHNLAWAYLKLDRFEDAIRENRILIEIDPMPWSITYSNLCEALLMANHYDQLPSALEEMRAINPHSRFYLNVKCFSQLVLGKLQEAEQTAFQMLQLDEPWQSVAQTKLAHIKIIHGDFDKAVEYLTKGLEIDKKHNLTKYKYEKYRLLCSLAAVLSDSQQSKKWLPDIEKIDTPIDAVELAAEINFKAGNFKRGEAFSEQAASFAAKTQEKQDRARVLRLQAQAALARFNRPRAISFLEHALETHDSPATRLLLARAYADSKQFDRAAIQYTIFIKNKARAFVANLVVEWVLAQRELARVYGHQGGFKNSESWQSKYREMWGEKGLAE